MVYQSLSTMPAVIQISLLSQQLSRFWLLNQKSGSTQYPLVPASPTTQPQVLGPQLQPPEFHLHSFSQIQHSAKITLNLWTGNPAKITLNLWTVNLILLIYKPTSNIFKHVSTDSIININRTCLELSMSLSIFQVRPYIGETIRRNYPLPVISNLTLS